MSSAAVCALTAAYGVGVDTSVEMLFAGRAGRARRYYRVQPSGIHALNDAHRTTSNIWRAVKWPVVEA